MNTVEASYEIQTYETSGLDLRIHWNIEQRTRTDQITSNTYTYWYANEALCNIYDNRNQIIEKIIATEYDTGAELATINNQERKPEEYQAYQNFRVLAKELADGWINREQINS